METKLIVSWLYDKAARAHDHSYARMLNMTAKRLRELDEKQRWIPVTERLPEGDSFLAATKMGFVGEAFIMQGEIYWQENCLDWAVLEPITERVTHWMPLPEPPKEVDNG